MGKNNKVKKGGYFLDAKLKALVTQYAASKVPNPVDVDDLVEYLVSVNPEYQRKPKTAMKLSAMKALKQLELQHEWKDQHPSDSMMDDSGEDDFIDSNIKLVKEEDHNILNASLIKNYKKKGRNFFRPDGYFYEIT